MTAPSRVWLLLAVGLALDAPVHARCGNRSADDGAVASAAATALAACPCEGGTRSSRCLRAAIRRVRVAHGLRSACRHEAFVAAAGAACTMPTLAGAWRLTGMVVEDVCGAAGLVESALMITVDGSVLTALGAIQPYSGTLRDDGWQLNNPFVQLGSCPTGEPGETFWLITGSLPDVHGTVSVEQTISWSGPIEPFAPCPACTVRWSGTMRRE